MKTILALGLSALVAYGLCTSLARACGDAECEAAWRLGFVNGADATPACNGSHGPLLTLKEFHEMGTLMGGGTLQALLNGSYDFEALLNDQGVAVACDMATKAYAGHFPLTSRVAAEDDCNVGVIAVYPERSGGGLVCMYDPE